jgi:hypothetical protein
MNLLCPTPPPFGPMLRKGGWAGVEHTIYIDKIEVNVISIKNIEFQLVLLGPYDDGDDETEAINNGVFVYPIQKFTRMATP